MSKNSKVVGCLLCGYRTENREEIAKWAGCPNCLKVSEVSEYLTPSNTPAPDWVNDWKPKTKN